MRVEFYGCTEGKLFNTRNCCLTNAHRKLPLMLFRRGFEGAYKRLRLYPEGLISGINKLTKYIRDNFLVSRQMGLEPEKLISGGL